jgi:hypothetical protein
MYEFRNQNDARALVRPKTQLVCPLFIEVRDEWQAFLLHY